MSNSTYMAGSIIIAWLMSPEALVLASNLAGISGPVVFIITFGAALVSYLALLITHYQSEQGEVVPGEQIVLHSFSVSAAVALAIFLPTGMLVTAGFTFNETFLYWFPNFGFSATILFAILLIQLAGEFAIKIAQRIFSSITVIGLFTIILVGLLSQTGAAPEPFITSGKTHYFALFALSLLLFLGSWHPSLHGISPAQLFLILFCGALFISLWQIVAIQYVAGEKLANSTIPYIFVAREVMGPSGRVIIGMSIISSTCAVVNYFFSLAIGHSHKLLSSIVAPKSNMVTADRLIVVLLATTIALCMATGLAGDVHLETYIYASLVLWLMSVAVKITFAWLKSRKLSHLILPAIFITAPFYLTITHEDPTSLVTFTALALCPSFIISSAVVLLGRRANH